MILIVHLRRRFRWNFYQLKKTFQNVIAQQEGVNEWDGCIHRQSQYSIIHISISKSPIDDVISFPFTMTQTKFNIIWDKSETNMMKHYRSVLVFLLVIWSILNIARDSTTCLENTAICFGPTVVTAPLQYLFRQVEFQWTPIRWFFAIISMFFIVSLRPSSKWSFKIDEKLVFFNNCCIFVLKSFRRLAKKNEMSGLTIQHSRPRKEKKTRDEKWRIKRKREKRKTQCSVHTYEWICEVRNKKYLRTHRARIENKFCLHIWENNSRR